MKILTRGAALDWLQSFPKPKFGAPVGANVIVQGRNRPNSVVCDISFFPAPLPPENFDVVGVRDTDSHFLHGYGFPADDRCTTVALLAQFDSSTRTVPEISPAWLQRHIHDKCTTGNQRKPIALSSGYRLLDGVEDGVPGLTVDVASPRFALLRSRSLAADCITPFVANSLVMSGAEEIAVEHSSGTSHVLQFWRPLDRFVVEFGNRVHWDQLRRHPQCMPFPFAQHRLDSIRKSAARTVCVVGDDVGGWSMGLALTASRVCSVTHNASNVRDTAAVNFGLEAVRSHPVFAWSELRNLCLGLTFDVAAIVVGEKSNTVDWFIDLLRVLRPSQRVFVMAWEVDSAADPFAQALETFEFNIVLTKSLGLSDPRAKCWWIEAVHRRTATC